MSDLQAGKIACEASNWSLSNIQLHKILYIAEMLYMGKYEMPLIKNDFEAWMYGPVLPDLYKRAKIYGAEPVLNIFHDVDTSGFSETDEESVIQFAVEKFGDLPGGRLVGITHRSNGGWDRNYRSDELHIRIPKKDILDEYKMVMANVKERK